MDALTRQTTRCERNTPRESRTSSLLRSPDPSSPPPADFSFVTHVFDDWAKKQPNQTAIWHVAGDLKTEHKISYAELVDLSHRAAILFASASTQSTQSDRAQSMASASAIA